MINLKACCGLLVSKDDEDHDYEDDGEPLPKPQSAVDHIKSLRSSGMGVGWDSVDQAAASERLPIKVRSLSGSRLAMKSEPMLPSARGKERPSESVTWGKGLPLRASSLSYDHEEEAVLFDSLSGEGQNMRGTSIAGPIPEAGSWGAGGMTAAVGGGGGSSKAENSTTPGWPGHARPSSRTSNSTSSISHSGDSSSDSRRGIPSIERGGSSRRLVPSASPMSSGAEATHGSVTRAASARMVAMASGALAALTPGSSGPPSASRARGPGTAGVARIGDGGRSVPVQDPVPLPVGLPVSKFDLAAFVAIVKRGVLLTKINRQGKAKVRTLFYDELNKVLWWNEPGAAARGGPRHRPSSLLSLRKEQPLPLIKLLEVRMASQLDIPFCFQGDVDKSFQLVFPTRTVDLVAKDEEEATLLAKGFQELRFSIG